MLIVDWINVGVSEMGSQARSSVMPPRTWPQLVRLPDGPWEAQKGVPSEVTGSELLAGPDKTQGSQTPQSFSEYLLSIRHWAYRMWKKKRCSHCPGRQTVRGCAEMHRR